MPPVLRSNLVFFKWKKHPEAATIILIQIWFVVFICTPKFNLGFLEHGLLECAWHETEAGWYKKTYWFSKTTVQLNVLGFSWEKRFILKWNKQEKSFERDKNCFCSWAKLNVHFAEKYLMNFCVGCQNRVSIWNSSSV